MTKLLVCGTLTGILTAAALWHKGTVEERIVGYFFVYDRQIRTYYSVFGYDGKPEEKIHYQTRTIISFPEENPNSELILTHKGEEMAFRRHPDCIYQ